MKVRLKFNESDIGANHTTFALSIPGGTADPTSIGRAALITGFDITVTPDTVTEVILTPNSQSCDQTPIVLQIGNKPQGVVTLPTVVTVIATGVNSVGATSGGTISSNGGGTITAKGIVYGTSALPTIAGSKTTNGVGSDAFTSSLLGLTSSQLYHYRAYATNSAGTAYGTELTFTTAAAVSLTLPTVVTLAIGSYAQTVAAGGGNITNDGGAGITVKGVCWSTNINPTTIDAKTTDGTGVGIFSSSLTALTASTAYYVRAYATNSQGTAYGNTVTFTTAAISQATAPIVLTTSILSGIVTTGGTSGGSISSEGSAAVTERGVCWATTPHPTIVNSKTSNGSGIGSFVSPITTMAENTLYYYRAYATNSVGTSYGPELSATTATTQVVQPVAPVVTTVSYTSATSTSGRLNANLVSVGSGTFIERGICYSKTNSLPTISDAGLAISGGPVGSFYRDITGLDPSTSYYFRAYAKNSETAYVYGSALIMTTSASEGGGASLPSIVTTVITGVGTSVSSGGTITSDGGATVTERGVTWGTSPNPLPSVLKTSNGTGTGVFTSTISGLVIGNTYYVRAYATNSVGTQYGNELSFTASSGVGTPIIYLTGSLAPFIDDDTPSEPQSFSISGSNLAGNISFQQPQGFELSLTPYVGYSSILSMPNTDGSISATNVYIRTTGNKNGLSGNVVASSTGALDKFVAANIANIHIKPGGLEAQTTVVGTAFSSLSILALGTGLSYQWYSNTSASNTGGSLISGATSSSYLPPSATIGVKYYYCVVSNVGGSATSPISGAITVGSSITMSVSIETGSPLTVPSGTPVILSCIVIGGGTSSYLTYVWKKGTTVISAVSGIPNQCSVIPTNGDSFTCTVTSTLSGVINPVVTSNAIVFVVNQLAVLETLPIESNEGTTALCGGTITSDNGLAITARGVCWGTSDNPTISNSKTTNGSGTGVFSSTLTGLTVGTTYYVRAYATNSAGTSYGSSWSFVQQAVAMIVSTDSITDRTAPVTGSVINNSGSAITVSGICWASANAYPTVDNAKTTDGGTSGTIQSLLSNLTWDVDYYVRAYATNANGTYYGNVVQSGYGINPDSVASLPAIQLNSATKTGETTATANITVTGIGNTGVVTMGVVYSKTTLPDLTDFYTSENGLGLNASKTTLLSMLDPGTKYYVRAYATNAFGTAYSTSELDFTTDVATIVLPTLSTAEITAITPTTAESGGTLLTIGGSTVTLRGVCWSTSPYPTYSDSKTTINENVTVGGAFTASLTGLIPETTYYVRAYAQGDEGVGYGDQKTFITTGNAPALAIGDSFGGGIIADILATQYLIVGPVASANDYQWDAADLAVATSTFGSKTDWIMPSIDHYGAIKLIPDYNTLFGISDSVSYWGYGFDEFTADYFTFSTGVMAQQDRTSYGGYIGIRFENIP